MRYGPEVAYDDKVDQLLDWTVNMEGVMQISADSLPTDCFDFIRAQYARFDVPFPDTIEQVLELGAQATLYHIDNLDPYALFMDISDVVMSDDWRNLAYEVGYPGDKVRMAEPEHTESFRLVQGQGMACAQHLMAHPGLDALPRDIGHGIRLVLKGEEGVDAVGALTEDSEKALRALCMTERGVDSKRFDAYFELASWATFVWLLTPRGHEFLRLHHDIFDSCMTYGECIIYDGCVVSPKFYKKHNRKPYSCFKCGLDAWCVELVQVRDLTQHICEKCLSGSAPALGGANCGTKTCKYVGCPNHPLHDMGRGGLYQHVRTSGQLIGIVKEPGLHLTGVSPKLITH